MGSAAITETASISSRDYYLIIDKSGSMRERDMPGRQKRWKAMAESTYALADEIIDHDDDGITIYTFSTRYKRYDNVVCAEKIKQIFKENSPFGGTQLAPVLKNAVEDYFKQKNASKSTNTGATIVVVTDGEPDNQQAVEDVIIDAANRVDTDDELGISFVQVGHDRGAEEFLKYLDNDLKGKAKHDIVDTIKVDEIEEEGLTAVLERALFN